MREYGRSRRRQAYFCVKASQCTYTRFVRAMGLSFGVTWFLIKSHLCQSVIVHPIKVTPKKRFSSLPNPGLQIKILAVGMQQEGEFRFNYELLVYTISFITQVYWVMSVAGCSLYRVELGNIKLLIYWTLEYCRAAMGYPIDRILKFPA